MIRKLQKLAVITGGSKGLGKALAHALVSRNIRVIIIGRSEASLAEVKAFNPQLITSICTDLSRSDSWADLAVQLADEQIDYLIHSASSIDPIGKIEDAHYEDWAKSIRINLDAPLFLTTALKALLVKNARILFVSSAFAYCPVVGISAYCASKAGLSIARQILSMENRQSLFASVLPGMMDTDMQLKIRESDASKLSSVDYFNRAQKNGDLIDPETSASFILWILTGTDDELYADQEWNIDDVEHIGLWRKSNTRIDYH
jgi:benzil reductase ((S)-benzoin forming)